MNNKNYKYVKPCLIQKITKMMMQQEYKTVTTPLPKKRINACALCQQKI